MTTMRPILVVDDNAEVRDGLRRVFNDAGYTVVMAASGREALAKLQEGLRPCGIVMDLMMPGMNGVEFRNEQVRNPAWAPIPVITYSGMTGERLQVAPLPGADAAQAQAKQIDSIMALVRQHCAKSEDTRH